MNAQCDPPFTDSIVALARSAMNRWHSGEMAWSCSETIAQDGRFFHPAVVAFSVNAATLTGRWLTAIVSATSADKSAQNASWKRGIGI